MTASAEKERAEFEAVASDNGKWPQAIERDAKGNYLLLTTANGWMWWQAARRAPAVPQGWKLVPVEPTTELLLPLLNEGELTAIKNRPEPSEELIPILLRLTGVRERYNAMLAAAPQPPVAAQLDDIDVADMAQAVDSTEAAPVQMPEPVAVAFRFETEEYGSTATSFYPSDRIGMGWTALYTEHQVRPLLAAQQFTLDELAMLTRKLVQQLRKASPGNESAEKALDYLKRKGLAGNPLRTTQELST